MPFALLGAVTVGLLEPGVVGGALALCVPMAGSASCGAIVSIVRDAPDPLAPPTAAAAAVPPEFAGFTSTIRLVYPLAISTLAGVPVLGVREQPGVGTVVRMVVARSRSSSRPTRRGGSAGATSGGPKMPRTFIETPGGQPGAARHDRGASRPSG